MHHHTRTTPFITGCTEEPWGTAIGAPSMMINGNNKVLSLLISRVCVGCYVAVSTSERFAFASTVGMWV